MYFQFYILTKWISKHFAQYFYASIHNGLPRCSLVNFLGPLCTDLVMPFFALRSKKRHKAESLSWSVLVVAPVLKEIDRISDIFVYK